MAAINNITGDKIVSRILSKEGYDRWDTIFPPKKTASEWVALKHPGLTIYDPDGWRYADGVTLNTKITEDDFNARLSKSTCLGWIFDQTKPDDT